MTSASGRPSIEIWGGIECTLNRVGDRWFDQMVWSGHDHRIEDLDRIASLGIRAVRYPALWERMAPHDLDDIDWAWTDERLARLRDRGIRPILGFLHHGSGPRYTDLLDEQFPAKLARFAAAVARRYPWVEDFTPVNEPLTTARFSALYGHWYPHERSDRAFVRALLNQMHATTLAMHAIRGIIPAARLVQTEDCGRAYGTRVTRAQVEHERHRRWLTWDLLCGRVTDRHPLHPFLSAAGMTEQDQRALIDRACPPQVVGLNYYATSDRYLDHRLERYPPATHGGNRHLRYADVEAVRARRAGIAGHESNLVEAWRRYRLPVALTEVHLGCTRDEQIRWLAESWAGALAAQARGVPVRAVTAWALFGSHNWNSLVTRDDGQYEPGAFDIRGPVPRPTAVASIVRALASGASPSHASLDGTPWWRRPERLIHRAMSAPSLPPPQARPLLIIGNGRLAMALHRICRARGLASRLMGRMEVDIGEPARIDLAIRRAEPWAIINAAGYVRVDEAERDPVTCHHANVAGTLNLAAACRRHRLPYVTFSSDLVFDGSSARAYTEDDEPRPLSVYASSKVEAERHIRDLLPETLIVRTGALFGAADQDDFLTRVFRALDSGLMVTAAADTTISPTYLPDLVHATLDLLVDGEEGLWHLANQGAVSWFAFARDAAARTGRNVEKIVPVDGARAWGPAPRPKFSALGSRRASLLRPLDAALGAYLDEVATMTPGSTEECAS